MHDTTLQRVKSFLNVKMISLQKIKWEKHQPPFKKTCLCTILPSPLFSFSDFKRCHQWFIFVLSKQFKCANRLCPIVEEGGRSHKMYQEVGVSTFLKIGRGLKALFAATIFHLRMSLKCSCGSGRHCEFWLKQHSNLLNLYKWHYFWLWYVV